MVTHEPDIASYARRNVIMRDGVIRNDREVSQRLIATKELERLKSETDDALEEVSK
jgi:putative ABC transport system ATP-binding protein